MAKFTLMLKMPDAGSDAIRYALEDGSLTPADEKAAKAVCKKFLEFDEYVYIELDTKAKTAKVKLANESA